MASTQKLSIIIDAQNKAQAAFTKLSNQFEEINKREQGLKDRLKAFGS